MGSATHSILYFCTAMLLFMGAVNSGILLLFTTRVAIDETYVSQGQLDRNQQTIGQTFGRLAEGTLYTGAEVMMTLHANAAETYDIEVGGTLYAAGRSANETDTTGMDTTAYYQLKEIRRSDGSLGRMIFTRI
ncbi:hypothetical protein [Paenibacillus lutrae]|uniref:Uncharacterized protein n=1 Tax=Paenibacillus lutrae TaxID=2078573 RepID=A0A7X3JYR8_9BACL|nr:hypothetical protein [Paenibacillus lutrae]MVO99287.1 hypothetical protein [Paenibacillus lutrae]